LADVAQQAEQAVQLHHWQFVQGPQAGDWRSLRTGSGMDFEEARPYQPGDDIRHLDWRSTARWGQPHIKTFREERQQVWAIAFDRSLSMRFGTRVRLKAAQGARAAIFIALAAQALGMTVHASLWDDEVQEFSTGHGPASSTDLVDAFNAPCPPDLLQEAPVTAGGMPAQAAGFTVGFSQWLEHLQAQLPPGSRLWLVSDAKAWDPAACAAMQALGEHHALTFVRICDPAEHDLPAIGWAEFVDLQGRSAQTWPAGSRSLAARLQETWSDRLKTQTAALAACDAQVIDLPAADDDLTQRLTTPHG
jgi:uncharacterized protein (DUF58 family)